MPANPVPGFVKTYDPKRIIVTFAGVPISGFADGTFVKIEPNAPRWAKHVGADGEVGRAKTNDMTHKVTLTLMMTALSNDWLNVMLLADNLSPPAGMGPLSVTDLNSVSLWLWPQAWIVQPPGPEYAKEVTHREWLFETGQAAVEAYNADYVSLTL